MENFSELIKRRRSMRKFTGEELTQDEVVSLLKAALMSPTSKRSNSWQFVVVDDKSTLELLSKCKEAGASFLKDAAVGIVVLGDPLASDVWIEDASVASIMIQLQAEDLGLGSCWIQVRERYTATGMSADEFVQGCWISLCSFRYFPLLRLGIKAWSGNLSMKTSCNGKRYTLINMVNDDCKGFES